MKLLFFTFLMTFSVIGFADETISDCTRGLMSQPLCISKINAKSFCARLGDSVGVVDKVNGCFQKLGVAFQNKQELTMMCLAGYKTSRNADENKSLCEDSTK